MEEDTRQGTALPTTDTAVTTRNPKRRFVGRRTADAQAKQRLDNPDAVEDATHAIQKCITICCAHSAHSC